MKREKAIRAFGEIEDRFLQEAMPGAKKAEKKRDKLGILRMAAAAAAALVLLAVPVQAERVNGYVSNLLAPLYGGAQTELVDQIGVPVDAQTAVGDYILSADAVIGDKYNIAIVYSLTRADGGTIEEGICFEDVRNSVRRGSGGGSSGYELSEDGKTLFLVEEWTSSRGLFLDRMAEVTFTDLIIENRETGEKTLLEAGEWTLKFTVRYEDSGVKLPGKDTVVRDAGGKEYTIHNIVVSPIGIHLDVTAPNAYEEYRDYQFPYGEFTMTVLLRDGRTVEVKDRNFGTHGKTDSLTHEGDVGALFPEPILLDQIQEILVCGTAFPFTE